MLSQHQSERTAMHARLQVPASTREPMPLTLHVAAGGCDKRGPGTDISSILSELAYHPHHQNTHQVL